VALQAIKGALELPLVVTDHLTAHVLGWVGLGHDAEHQAQHRLWQLHEAMSLPLPLLVSSAALGGSAGQHKLVKSHCSGAAIALSS